MNPQDWKQSVTGANCPLWCAADHTDEDPENESIIHVSTPITVALPRGNDGQPFRFTFSLTSSQEYSTDDHTPTRVDLSMEAADTGPVWDYIPVRTRQELNQLISGLRQAASDLEQWRGQLGPRTA